MEIKLVLEEKELNEYLSGERKNIFYDKALEEYNKLNVHASGETPVKLIATRRPSESDEVLKYRKEIYESKTEPVFSKVWSSLMKIRRSSDWKITYPEPSEFPRVREGETIEDYLEMNFPKHKSITSWAFTELLRQYLIDPNGVVFIKPEKTDIEEKDFLKPIPLIFNSENVLDYVEENFCLLKNPEGALYRNKAGNLTLGESYYFISTIEIVRYDQVSSEQRFEPVFEYAHGLGFLPVMKMKGVLYKTTENYSFYKSRLAGMIPELNEAAREYSDFQASMVTSAYAERWEYTQTMCTECEGTGKRINPHWFDSPECKLPPHLTCQKCNGRAYVVAGPYAKLMVTPSSATDPNNANVPTPPAGYLQKDVEIIKLQDASVDKHLYSALAAINFQFLDQNPLNVSGVKTEIDKDELNNTVHGIAEDLVSIIDFVNKAVVYYRYKVLYPDTEDLDNMLPEVPVPEKFDLIGSTGIMEEMKQVKESNVNPVIKNAYEIDFANKKFYNDPKIGEFVHLVLSLDPLPNILQDDKQAMQSNKGVTQIAYIISCNIVEFIRRAIDENEKFPELDRPEQLEVLEKYALEVIKANDDAAKITASVMPNGFPMRPGNNGANSNGQPSNGFTDDDNEQILENELENAEN